MREPLALYIHWPFCQSKCPYCDFNSHVRERVDAARWTRALVADLERQARGVPEHRLSSIFFGGGTPSLMPPETVAALVAAARAHWPAEDDLEVTLEANPSSSEAETFAELAQAGVNRLSLGIQSLDPAALAFLGRRHGRAEALAAIALAARHFPRFSFDLIYARPGQSARSWADELDEALGLAGEHLSLYQLTIEPGTGFAGQAARGTLVVPDEESAALLFEATQARLEQHGLPAYEISNHARPGAECRHNLAYWRYQDYLGIGPGAHGRVTRAPGAHGRVTRAPGAHGRVTRAGVEGAGVKHAIRQRRLPERWLADIERCGTAIEETEAIPRETALEEMLMMGLRLTEGIPRARIETLAQRPLEAIFGARLAPLVEGGFLTLDRHRLAASAAGRQRLNAVLASLLV